MVRVISKTPPTSPIRTSKTTPQKKTANNEMILFLEKEFHVINMKLDMLEKSIHKQTNSLSSGLTAALRADRIAVSQLKPTTEKCSQSYDTTNQNKPHETPSKPTEKTPSIPNNGSSRVFSGHVRPKGVKYDF